MGFLEVYRLFLHHSNILSLVIKSITEKNTLFSTHIFTINFLVIEMADFDHFSFYMTILGVLLLHEFQGPKKTTVIIRNSCYWRSFEYYLLLKGDLLEMTELQRISCYRRTC